MTAPERPTPFPKPTRAAAGDAPKQPCGECHLKPGEVCDICGAVAPMDAISGQPLEQVLYDQFLKDGQTYIAFVNALAQRAAEAVEQAERVGRGLELNAIACFLEGWTASGPPGWQNAARTLAHHVRNGAHRDARAPTPLSGDAGNPVPARKPFETGPGGLWKDERGIWREPGEGIRGGGA